MRPPDTASEDRMRAARYLVPLILASSSFATEAPSGAAEAAKARAFPVTFDRVWFRTGAPKVFGGPQQKGFLTINTSTIELVGRKRSLVWPLPTLRMVSLGRLAGDVDPQWVVVDLDGREGPMRVGLRDGRRFGWGGRTEEIYDAMREAARIAGTAQFAAPAGFEPYAELDFQFALPIPAGWSTHHQSVVGVEGRALHGTVVITPEPLVEKGGAPDQRARAAARVGAGEITAWIVTRRLSPSGFNCDHPPGNLVARLREWIGDEPTLADGVDLGGAEAEPTTLGGCSGSRMLARGARVLDLRAVSDGATVFLVGLRTTAESYEMERTRFETGLAGFKLALTR
jgi:hypothetical protein